ncbi:MAG: cytochrome b [Hyphomicrobium sp.]
MLKSRPDGYGTVAVSIHWLSAVLILALLGSGFQAANAMDSATKAAFLRFHIPTAIMILMLTILRIVWWRRFDLKPVPVEGSPAWQERIAGWVHIAFYAVIFGMIASGIGTIILSGAAPAVFGEPGVVLPDFTNYPPRVPHGLGARLLVALLVFHGGAALYHHYIRSDGLLRRMWYGR